MRENLIRRWAGLMVAVCASCSGSGQSGSSEGDVGSGGSTTGSGGSTTGSGGSTTGSGGSTTGSGGSTTGSGTGWASELGGSGNRVTVGGSTAAGGSRAAGGQQSGGISGGGTSSEGKGGLAGATSVGGSGGTTVGSGGSGDALGNTSSGGNAGANSGGSTTGGVGLGSAGTTTSCDNKCSTEGFSECTEAGTRTCQLINGCLRWSAYTSCSYGCDGTGCATCTDLPTIVTGSTPLTGEVRFFLAAPKPGVIYALGNSSFDTIDVSDPTSPQVINTVEDYPGDSVRSALVFGNYVVTSDRIGISLFDISNPVQPVFIKTLGDLASWRIVTDGQYLYTIDSNKLFTLKLQPDLSVATVATTSLASNTSDLAYMNGYVYLISNNQLHVYDVSNPTKPTFAGAWSATGYRAGSIVAISPEYAFVLCASTSSTVSKTFAVSLANPKVPVTVPGGPSDRIQVVGDEVFEFSMSGLYRRRNTQGFPVISGGAIGIDMPGAFFVSDKYLYFAPSSALMVARYDAMPQIVSQSDISMTGSESYGNLVYYATKNSVCTLDVTDPKSPLEVGCVTIPQSLSGGRHLVRDGDRLYVRGWAGSDGDVALTTLSLKVPARPQVLGTSALGRSINYETRFVVRDGTMICEDESYNLGFSVYDVSDPTNAVLIRFYPTSEYLGDMLWIGNYALIGFDGMIHSYLATDPSNMVDVDSSSGASNFFYRAGYVYRIGSTAVRVIDFTVPPIVNELSSFAEMSLNNDVGHATSTNFSHYLIAAGAGVIDVTDLTKPKLVFQERWPNHDTAYASHTVNGYGVTITTTGWMVVDRCH